jgi:O-acetyl-ADP-ribose deacetylase (regulator of RNase III)
MRIEKYGKTLTLIQGDITTQEVDAIVNAANSQLAHGAGVAAAIASAGGELLQKESEEHPVVQTGEVGVTTAGNLNAKIVIHAVGPMWKDGTHGEPELLASAIKNSIIAADERGLKSIAFPAISTGIYGYPLVEAAKVIINSTLDSLETTRSISDVRIVLFGEHYFQAFQEQLQILRA